jgi:hypothetical protein
MEALWAPKDNSVFDLVPALFEEQVSTIYQNHGSPLVSSNNFWTVYQILLADFRQVPYVAEMEHIFEEQQRLDPMKCEVDVQLIPGLKPLRNDHYLNGVDGEVYLGGVRDLVGKADEIQRGIDHVEDTVLEESGGGTRVFAELTSDEDEDKN